jgi:hypothetical protein
MSVADQPALGDGPTLLGGHDQRIAARACRAAAQGPCTQVAADLRWQTHFWRYLCSDDSDTPPVLFFLAEWYYKRGQIDEAIFWLNAAGLRGLFDAAICTDRSAGSAMTELDQSARSQCYQ